MILLSCLKDSSWMTYLENRTISVFINCRLQDVFKRYREWLVGLCMSDSSLYLCNLFLLIFYVTFFSSSRWLELINILQVCKFLFNFVSLDTTITKSANKTINHRIYFGLCLTVSDVIVSFSYVSFLGLIMVSPDA